MGQPRRIQEGIPDVCGGQLRFRLDLAGKEGRRQPGHCQHGRGRHTIDHRRQGVAVRGRMGTRLLYRLPQPASEVRRDIPEPSGELGFRREELRLTGRCVSSE